MNKRTILSCLSAALLLAVAAAAQTSKATTETGFVAAVSDSKITLSNVPLGGGRQGAGPGEAGETRAIAVRRGPDGKPQEVELTPEEEAKLRAQAKSGGPPRFVVREGGQERELTPEEAEKLRAKMKAEGKEVHVVGGPGQAGAGGGGAAVQRASEPMKLSDFVVDGKTKKKGELKVGTRVTVAFREENGQKIATSIAPAQ